MDDILKGSKCPNKKINLKDENRQIAHLSQLVKLYKQACAQVDLKKLKYSDAELKSIFKANTKNSNILRERLEFFISENTRYAKEQEHLLKEIDSLKNKKAFLEGQLRHARFFNKHLVDYFSSEDKEKSFLKKSLKRLASHVLKKDPKNVEAKQCLAAATQHRPDYEELMKKIEYFKNNDGKIQKNSKKKLLSKESDEPRILSPALSIAPSDVDSCYNPDEENIDDLLLTNSTVLLAPLSGSDSEQQKSTHSSKEQLFNDLISDSLENSGSSKVNVDSFINSVLCSNSESCNPNQSSNYFNFDDVPLANDVKNSESCDFLFFGGSTVSSANFEENTSEISESELLDFDHCLLNQANGITKTDSLVNEVNLKAKESVASLETKDTTIQIVHPEPLDKVISLKETKDAVKNSSEYLPVKSVDSTDIPVNQSNHLEYSNFNNGATLTPSLGNSAQYLKDNINLYQNQEFKFQNSGRLSENTKQTISVPNSNILVSNENLTQEENHIEVIQHCELKHISSDKMEITASVTVPDSQNISQDLNCQEFSDIIPEEMDNSNDSVYSSSENNIQDSGYRSQINGNEELPDQTLEHVSHDTATIKNNLSENVSNLGENEVQNFEKFSHVDENIELRSSTIENTYELSEQTNHKEDIVSCSHNDILNKKGPSHVRKNLKPTDDSTKEVQKEYLKNIDALKEVQKSNLNISDVSEEVVKLNSNLDLPKEANNKCPSKSIRLSETHKHSEVSIIHEEDSEVSNLEISEVPELLSPLRSDRLVQNNDKGNSKRYVSGDDIVIISDRIVANGVKQIKNENPTGNQSPARETVEPASSCNNETDSSSQNIFSSTHPNLESNRTENESVSFQYAQYPNNGVIYDYCDCQKSSIYQANFQWKFKDNTSVLFNIPIKKDSDKIAVEIINTNESSNSSSSENPPEDENISKPNKDNSKAKYSILLDLKPIKKESKNQANSIFASCRTPNTYIVNSSSLINNSKKRVKFHPEVWKNWRKSGEDKVPYADNNRNEEQDVFVENWNVLSSRIFPSNYSKVDIEKVLMKFRSLSLIELEGKQGAQPNSLFSGFVGTFQACGMTEKPVLHSPLPQPNSNQMTRVFGSTVFSSDSKSSSSFRLNSSTLTTQRTHEKASCGIFQGDNTNSTPNGASNADNEKHTVMGKMKDLAGDISKVVDREQNQSKEVEPRIKQQSKGILRCGKTPERSPLKSNLWIQSPVKSILSTNKSVLSGNQIKLIAEPTISFKKVLLEKEKTLVPVNNENASIVSQLSKKINKTHLVSSEEKNSNDENNISVHFSKCSENPEISVNINALKVPQKNKQTEILENPKSKINESNPTCALSDTSPTDGSIFSPVKKRNIPEVSKSSKPKRDSSSKNNVTLEDNDKFIEINSFEENVRKKNDNISIFDSKSCTYDTSDTDVELNDSPVKKKRKLNDDSERSGSSTSVNNICNESFNEESYNHIKIPLIREKQNDQLEENNMEGHKDSETVENVSVKNKNDCCPLKSKKNLQPLVNKNKLTTVSSESSDKSLKRIRSPTPSLEDNNLEEKCNNNDMSVSFLESEVQPSVKKRISHFNTAHKSYISQAPSKQSCDTVELPIDIKDLSNDTTVPSKEKMSNDSVHATYILPSHNKSKQDSNSPAKSCFKVPKEKPLRKKNQGNKKEERIKLDEAILERIFNETSIVKPLSPFRERIICDDRTSEGDDDDDDLKHEIGIISSQNMDTGKLEKIDSIFLPNALSILDRITEQPAAYSDQSTNNTENHPLRRGLKILKPVIKSVPNVVMAVKKCEDIEESSFNDNHESKTDHEVKHDSLNYAALGYPCEISQNSPEQNKEKNQNCDLESIFVNNDSKTDSSNVDCNKMEEIQTSYKSCDFLNSDPTGAPSVIPMSKLSIFSAKPIESSYFERCSSNQDTNQNKNVEKENNDISSDNHFLKKSLQETFDNDINNPRKKLFDEEENKIGHFKIIDENSLVSINSDESSLIKNNDEDVSLDDINNSYESLIDLEGVHHDNQTDNATQKDINTEMNYDESSMTFEEESSILEKSVCVKEEFLASSSEDNKYSLFYDEDEEAMEITDSPKSTSAGESESNYSHTVDTIKIENAKTYYAKLFNSNDKKATHTNMSHLNIVNILSPNRRNDLRQAHNKNVDLKMEPRDHKDSITVEDSKIVHRNVSAYDISLNSSNINCQLTSSAKNTGSLNDGVQKTVKKEIKCLEVKDSINPTNLKEKDDNSLTKISSSSVRFKGFYMDTSVPSHKDNTSGHLDKEDDGSSSKESEELENTKITAQGSLDKLMGSPPASASKRRHSEEPDLQSKKAKQYGGSEIENNIINNDESNYSEESNSIDCYTNLLMVSLKHFTSEALSDKVNLNKKSLSNAKEVAAIKTIITKVTTTSEEEMFIVTKRVAEELMTELNSVMPRPFAIAVNELIRIDPGSESKDYPFTTKNIKSLVLLTIAYVKRDRSILLEILKVLDEFICAYYEKTLTVSDGVNLVSYYTLLCIFYDIPHVAQKLMYDVLYSRHKKAVPMIYIMLKIWPKLLLKINECTAKDCPVTKVFVYTLLTATKDIHGEHCESLYKVRQIRGLLKCYYGYTLDFIRRDEICQKMFQRISSNACKQGLVLLSIREGFEWGMGFVQKNLFPVLNDWANGTGDRRIAQDVALCVGMIVRAFPLTKAAHFVINTLDLLERVLHHSPDPEFAEAVIESISYLRRHNIIMCSLILMKWTPSFKKITNKTLEHVRHIVSVKNIKFWKLFYNKNRKSLNEPVF